MQPLDLFIQRLARIAIQAQRKQLQSTKQWWYCEAGEDGWWDAWNSLFLLGDCFTDWNSHGLFTLLRTILAFFNGTFESMILNFPTLGGIWYGICDFFLDGDHFNHHFFSQRHRWQSEITKDGKIREGLGTVPWFMSRKPNGQRKGWCRVTSYLKPMKDSIFHLARLLFCFYFLFWEDFHVEDLFGYLDNSTTMIDSQRVGVFRFFSAHRPWWM